MARVARRPGWIGLVVGVLVVLAVLWLGYWFAAMRIAEAAITRAVSAPVAGHRIECPERNLSGFPLRIDVRCARATYTDPQNSLTAAVGGVSASAPLYRPGYVDATLGSPLVINAPGENVGLTVSWSNATASLSAWLKGLTSGSAHFFNLGVETSGSNSLLRLAGIKAAEAAASISPLSDGNYRLAASANKLDLSRASGAAFPELDVDATITAEQLGTSLGTNPPAKLRDWLRRGGTAKIDRLRIAAAGTVLLVSGSLRLSPEGRLNGSLLLAYNDLDALGRFLDAIKPGAGTRNATNLQMMNAATKTLTTDEGTFHQTGVVVQDGSFLLLGILPLPFDPIPPIRF